jgi:mannose-6-phosphate isomerase-like protein (cupin superfamily)
MTRSLVTRPGGSVSGGQHIIDPVPRKRGGVPQKRGSLPLDFWHYGEHRLRQTAVRKRAMESRPPSIIDLNAELAKLAMFRRSPRSTPVERKGSVAQLAAYRDGLLLAIKASGRDHWERHLAGDELVHILDGTATLEVVCDDGPPKSFVLRPGMVAVVPQGAWHRLLSSEGATQIAVTPFPGETIELDVDDPRKVER